MLEGGLGPAVPPGAVREVPFHPCKMPATGKVVPRPAPAARRGATPARASARAPRGRALPPPLERAPRHG